MLKKYNKSVTLAVIISMLMYLIILPTNVMATSYNVTSDSTWNWSYNDSSSYRTVTLQAYKGTDTNLTYNEIPTTLDGTWFAANGGCNLSTYEVDLGNNTYANESIAAFDYSSTPAYNKTTTKLTSLELPYGFTSCGGTSFRSQTELTQLFIPDSVTSLATNTFLGCSNIQTIVLSANLTSIGGANFYNMKSGANVYFRTLNAPSMTGSALCANGQNINIYYPAGGNLPSYQALTWYGGTPGTITYNTYTSLPTEADTYYDTIGSGGQPSPSPSPTQSAEPATNFNYTTVNNEINITAYWPKDGGGNPTNRLDLQQVVIPLEINSMPVVSINQAFYYKSTATQGSNGYTLSKSQSFIIPDSVRTITQYSFRNQSTMASIELPTALTSLATNTFMDCSSLTSITFKGMTAPTVTGAPANKALTVYYPAGGTGYTDSSWRSYFYTGTTFVELGGTPTPTPSPTPTPTPTPAGEPETNFTYAQSGTGINITGYWPLDSNGNPANSTTLQEVIIPSEINGCRVASLNSSFYYKSTATQGSSGYTLSKSVNFVIPNSVRYITTYTFRAQSTMTSVDLPTDLTSLAVNAFYDCTALTSITFKGMAAPSLTGAPANKALTVYYPSGGAGYTDSAWRSKFYSGTTFVETAAPSPTPTPTINPNDYPQNRIFVVSPAYTSTINGNTSILICARGFTQLAAKCWKQGSGYGTDDTVATVTLNNGVGGFTFPASQYPHGPITIKITGTAGSITDECNLQLYNTAGTSWNEGLSNAPTPPQINSLGLSVVYQDDFATSDLSINKTDTSKKYTSHTFGYKDFSGIPFKDYESQLNPFSQMDTYMRIRADNFINSSGLISSLHQDGSGFAVKAPAYFECKFIAQNAEGTWPAFWTLTNTTNSNFTNGEKDELDVIEAYGFDSSQSQFATMNGYTAGTHNWNQTPYSHQYTHVNMKALGGNGMWYQGFHTYGVLVTATDTVFYCDNIEVMRRPTMAVSAVDYTYFLINFAIGGTSGWQYDLSRYNGTVDMYVDWVRVYGLSQNVMPNS